MTSRKTVFAVIAVPSLVLALLGCEPAVDDPEQTQFAEVMERALAQPADGTLVARVALSPTHAFEFYELGPGLVAYSEMAHVSEQPTSKLGADDLDRLAPSEVFRRLVGGRVVVPTRLRDLDRRWTAARPSGPSGSVATISRAQTVHDQVREGSGGLLKPGQVQTTPGACPGDLFSTASGPLGPFCPSVGIHQKFCLLNKEWVVIDGHSASPQSNVLATVCADRGPAKFVVDRIRLPSLLTFDVPEGFWRQHRADATCGGFLGTLCAEFKIKYDVLPTGGNVQFGAGIRFR